MKLVRGTDNDKTNSLSTLNEDVDSSDNLYVAVGPYSRLEDLIKNTIATSENLVVHVVSFWNSGA